MSSAPPTGPVAPLPVWATVGAVFRAVLAENIRHFPRAVLTPLFISLVLLLLQIRFGSPTMIQGEELDPMAPPAFSALDVLLALAGVVPYVIFSVAWHRLLLMGPVRGLPAWHPSWTSRHWLFLAYMLLLGLIMAGLALALAMVAGLLVAAFAGAGAGPEASGAEPIAILISLFVLATMGWVFARFSFVLPARALDERYGLGDSWRQTRGQGLRILATFVIVQIIIALPTILVVGFLAAGSGVMGAINQMSEGYSLEALILFVGALPLVLAGYLASYLSTALGVTVLSLAFKTCSGWTPDAARGPPPEPQAS